MNETQHPHVGLRHLDYLWFQVTGTLCNLACTHCFNSSGPGVRAFGFLSMDQVSSELTWAVEQGLKEVFFTGGEPFLHPQIAEMLKHALRFAPASVLTNVTLISEEMADRLAEIEAASRYSLEIRASLDSFDEAANDAIRGAGVFRKVMEGLKRLSQRGLLPLVTVVRTWPDDADSGILPGFVRLLQDAGYSRPRLKILPALPLGRELVRLGAVHREPLLTEEMLRGFDLDLLMCTNSRLVTDRGVYVCPLLLEMPDARLGATLEESARAYELRHNPCFTCFQYGTICGNVNAQIEGPGKSLGDAGEIHV